jgi:hypothetical protein
MSAAAKVWRGVKHYTYAMVITSFNSGIKSMDAVIGLAVGAAVTVTVPSPTWEAGVAVFLTTFARSILMYLKDHPLPDKLPEELESLPVTITQTKETTQTTTVQT